MSHNTYLPHFLTGLITGACIGFAVLMEYIMQTREPADLPHVQPDAAPAPPPDADAWIDAAFADALRKQG